MNYINFNGRIVEAQAAIIAADNRSLLQTTAASGMAMVYLKPSSLKIMN